MKYYYTILDYKKLYKQHNSIKSFDNLPFDRFSRLTKYRNLEDKLRCYYAWGILRKNIYAEFGLDINNLEIVFNRYGKPKLKKYNDINFNIAHSGEIVCCAIDRYPVGIDVELIRTFDYNLGSYFLSNIELLNFKKDLNEEYLFKIWTLKEAFIKAEGVGFNMDLRKFTFFINDNNIVLLPNKNNWKFKNIKLITKENIYYLSVCFKNKY